MAALHHLALRTLDVPSLVGFYRAWLGAKVVREQLPRSVWLELAHDAVLMIELRSADEPAPPYRSSELIAFRVSVEERLRLRAAFVAHGILEAETGHTLYVRDPDGRRVGFSSYALP